MDADSGAAGDGLTNDGSPTLSGTAEPGAVGSRRRRLDLVPDRGEPLFEPAEHLPLVLDHQHPGHDSGPPGVSYPTGHAAHGREVKSD